MKKTFYLSFISLLLLIFGSSFFWFENILTPPVNADEVVWVLDARFYQFRRQKNWHKFELTESPRFLGWSNDKFRLIDQPQLGKYIYGFIIQTNNLKPWIDSQTRFLYRQFASLRLNLDSIKIEYPELISSINLLRIIGSIVGFISIITFGLMVHLFTKSQFIGGLTIIFLIFHPTLFYLYRIAVPNSFQILLIIWAISLIFYLMNHLKVLSLKKKILWLVAGMLVATSTSIKLNGFFLLFGPLFVWIVQEIKASVSQRETFQYLVNKIKANLLLLSGFSVTFYFLEPELWGHPLRGLSLLFSARLDQHRRFLLSFENYGFFETIWFLIVQFLKISDLLVVKLLLIVFLVFGLKKVISNLPHQYWLNLSLLLLSIMISNTFYANVGFDRYAEWSTYIFSFLSALGMREFIKIIYHQVKQV